jgi:hypothetical protein
MGFASHLGPWRLGTVKDTTGTTAGTVSNMGCTIVSQTFKKDYTGTTTAGTANVIATLPAGAQIIEVMIDTLVAFTGSTAANLTIGNGTTADLYWATTDVTVQQRYSNDESTSGAASKLANWAGAATTAAPNGAGIGATDVLVTATMTPTVASVTAGTVQYTIMYAVHNSDGAQAPASA